MMLRAAASRLSGKKSKDRRTAEEANFGCKDDWSKYDERLLDCCRRGDLVRLKATLQKKGVSPVKIDKDGSTALHLCCQKGNADCVELMLKEEPDLSVVDREGRTVYHISASLGDSSILKKLIEYSRCHLDIVDKTGMTALHKAVIGGDLACVKLLLDTDAPRDIKDQCGRTPLILSIQENQEKMAVTLILNEANVNAQDTSGRTPLVYACTKGLTSVVSLLLSKGANAHVQDAFGKTPEMLASEAGNNEVITLLRNGVDAFQLHERDMKVVDEVADQSTPVHASTNGHVKLNGQTDSVGSPSEPGRNRSDSLESPSFSEVSFTSSIIDSLRAFDMNGDLTSEMSVCEEQWHSKEKELEGQLLKKDRRIESLETEVIELKNRLQREFDKRLSTEDELRALNVQFNTLKDEVRLNGTLSDDADVSLRSNRSIMNLQGISCKEEVREPSDEKGNQVRELKGASDQHENDQREIKKNNALIHFLEEKILGLEEDMSKKEDIIQGLEAQVKDFQIREENLAHAAVSLDVYNQLKTSKRHEKDMYQEEIHALEDQVERLEQEVRDSKKEALVLRTEMNSSDNEKIKFLELQNDSLQAQLEGLQDELTALREKMEGVVTDYTETIHAYRINLLALYQNKCDKDVEIALRRIVALRRGEMDVDL